MPDYRVLQLQATPCGVGMGSQPVRLGSPQKHAALCPQSSAACTPATLPAWKKGLLVLSLTRGRAAIASTTSIPCAAHGVVYAEGHTVVQCMDVSGTFGQPKAQGK